MNHPLTQIWIHAIWSTRDRLPLMKKNFRTQLDTYLRYKLQEMGCLVRIINGTVDHMHALFQLPHERPLTRLMDHIKGESSRWINQQRFLQTPFSWETGYCALSVSGSVVPRVEAFIRDQTLLHQKMTFDQEYRQFLTKCGFIEQGWIPSEIEKHKRPVPVTAQEIEWESPSH
ncbi:transposase [bacterium]|nr:transposase [bacterium]